ncbi:MAG: SpaA isopeptide-forming pilin-related protein, partial [Anaerococcus sp.]
INVDGVQLGKDYLLEEVDSPDGYAKTKYKYRLRFAYDASWDTPFVATLVAVLKEVNNEDGTTKWVPLTNEAGKNITDSGQYLGSGQSINTGFQFRIVNKKTEMEFTKVGKEGDKETPLKDVEFYLEKQDPNDAKYYPLTENGEFIKSQTNRKGDGLDYYIERIVDGKVEKLFAVNFKLVTIEGFAKKYKSDADGKFKITDLKDGYYRIIEPKAAKDANGEEYMKVNGPVKRFRVVDGVVRIISKDETTGKLVEKEVNDKNAKELGKIINQKSGFGEFKLNKYDDNENPMAKVEFDLVSADADERVVQSGTTDEKGQIHFKNLPYGYYWLVEKKTVDGYIVDTKKKLISLGGDKKWNVPEKNTDVSSSILFDGVQPDLVSTSGDRNTVYPNKEEAVVARFKLKFADPSKIAPGNHFTIKLTEDVDIDGIVKDNNGEGKSDTSFLNIIGPAGVLAKAEVDKNRRTITYTFTDYVKDYTPIDMNLFLQLYPNRYKLTHSQTLNLTADIGENKNTTDTSKHFEKSIYIDYRSPEGYQDPDKDVSSYTLRLEPDGKTFTAVIYYNQWNRLLEDKNIEFFTDKKIDTDSLSVKTYKKVNPTTGEREEGSHANGWQQGDLPDSYGID